MKKRLIIIFILVIAHLIIQVAFYAETVARTEPKHVESYARRINYILEEVVKPEEKKKEEQTERQIKNVLEVNEHNTENIEEEVIEELYYSSGCLTPEGGVYWFGDQKETYYNLPMDVIVSIAESNGIEGEYWIRDDGCKMLGDYIILACNRSVHPYGSIVETSLGYGISLDTGGFAESNPYQVDIAVNW